MSDIPFLTDDRMFLLGFEFGMEAERLKKRPARFCALVDLDNEERIRALLARSGYRVTRVKVLGEQMRITARINLHEPDIATPEEDV